jgi:hypothetical protein
MKDDHGSIHGDNRWQEGGFSILELLVFQTMNFGKENQIWVGGQKYPLSFWTSWF